RIVDMVAIVIMNGRGADSTTRSTLGADTKRPKWLNAAVEKSTLAANAMQHEWISAAMTRDTEHEMLDTALMSRKQCADNKTQEWLNVAKRNSCANAMRHSLPSAAATKTMLGGSVTKHR
ncbi:MAG: hypothetical protein M1830_004105, partial [Pleopsidium flavum]